MEQQILALAFDEENRAGEVLRSLRRLEDNGGIILGDAVFATKAGGGKIRLHQTMDLTARGGLVSGMATGALLGRLNDAGPDNGWVREVSESIPPGGSAHFLLVTYANREAALREAERHRGGARLLRASLPDEVVRELRKALAET